MSIEINDHGRHAWTKKDERDPLVWVVLLNGARYQMAYSWAAEMLEARKIRYIVPQSRAHNTPFDDSVPAEMLAEAKQWMAPDYVVPPEVKAKLDVWVSRDASLANPVRCDVFHDTMQQHFWGQTFSPDQSYMIMLAYCGDSLEFSPHRERGLACPFYAGLHWTKTGILAANVGATPRVQATRQREEWRREQAAQERARAHATEAIDATHP